MSPVLRVAVSVDSPAKYFVKKKKKKSKFQKKKKKKGKEKEKEEKKSKGKQRKLYRFQRLCNRVGQERNTNHFVNQHNLGPQQVHNIRDCCIPQAKKKKKKKKKMVVSLGKEKKKKTSLGS